MPQLQAPEDPNWLLSTSAQSAAAMIAIVGGFLVSRVISLSSERSGHLRRIREAEARAKILRGEASGFEKRIRAVAARWFTDHHLDDLIVSRGSLSGEEMVSEWMPHGGRQDWMIPYADSLAEVAREAFTRIEATYSGAKYPPKDVGQLRQEGVEIQADATVESIYGRAAEEIARQRRKNAPSSLFPSAAALAGIVGTSNYGAYVRPVRSDAERALHAKQMERKEALDVEIAGLDADVQVLRHELELLGTPRSLLSGFGVLVYFGVVGILLPLCLMATRPVPDSARSHWVVVLGFASGFGALCVYVFVAIRGLQLGTATSNGGSGKLSGIWGAVVGRFAGRHRPAAAPQIQLLPSAGEAGADPKQPPNL